VGVPDASDPAAKCGAFDTAGSLGRDEGGDDSMDKGQAWYNSAAYQAILPVRKDNAKSNFFLVEGVPQ
jgi:hypothetical protein